MCILCAACDFGSLKCSPATFVGVVVSVVVLVVAGQWGGGSRKRMGAAGGAGGSGGMAGRVRGCEGGHQQQPQLQQHQQVD